jgi:glycosyltransferase involved in cell wall biosynthesis
MSAPAFSILVPAYNAERTLASALASVDRQTDPDFEVVIVDDGSTDGTRELAERLAHGKQWQVVHQDNRGLPSARNAALAAARGRWVALLDADDWYLPDFLATMRQLLTRGTGVGLAFVDAWGWEETRGRFFRRSVSGPYRPRPLPAGQWPLFSALSEQNFIFVAAAAPREVLQDLGGFEPSLRAAEDWEMWLRVVAAGYRLAGTDERLAVYRDSPGQMSKDRERMCRGRLDALRSVRGKADLPLPVADALDSRILRAEAAVAAYQAEVGDARTLRSRAIAPIRPVRDFRLRAPRAVARALPELSRGRAR